MRRPTDDIGRLASEEKAMGLFDRGTYARMGERIAAQGKKLREQIADWKAAGKKIAGYGAPAKLTTLMYAFGLRREDFDFIIDDSRWKQGLLTPGLHIPVRPSRETYVEKAGDRVELILNQEKIDVCIVFAWNFFDSIVEKNGAWKGLFVNPLI